MEHIIGVYGIAVIAVTGGMIGHQLNLTMLQTVFLVGFMMIALDFVVMAAKLIEGH